MQKIKSIALGFFALAIAIPSFSQNSTYSPYTRYGYGQLAESGFGASRAMGGTSLGTRDKKQINPNNPASYSVIDSTTFLFDFGLKGEIGNFKQGAMKSTNYNGNIDYIAMQFPIAKGIGASVGILPYSFVGYQFGDSIKPKGQTSNFAENSYYGSGGFSQAYLGIAGRLFNHVSLGVNLNYLFGTISHTSQTYFTGSTTASIITNEIRVRAFKPEFGAQFFTNISKDRSICIGLKYIPKVNLNSTAKKLVYKGDSVTLAKKFELAETYGAGLSMQLNKQWHVALDGTYQKWADAQYYSYKDTLNNRTRISAGAEFTPNALGRRYYERMRYRFGGYYSNNYLNVKNSNLSEFGVSAGLGLPLKKIPTQSSFLNISVEYSRMKPEYSSFLYENYLKFTVSLTLDEFWFFKRKLE
ncbi:hypothetical protein [Parabacteroides sp. FAFU027]|uniref:hypothetical protein n=1 Tax=Parabacteroides sp. FAFU027 TaxID=2922715 RepID=UPI001FAEF76E|nr:hypothetical protein [Parabacteroides sp. FAFU027]